MYCVTSAITSTNVLLWAVIGTSFHVQSTLSCNPTRIALEQALKFNVQVHSCSFYSIQTHRQK